MFAMLEWYLKLENIVNSIWSYFNLSSPMLSKDELALIKDAVKCITLSKIAITFLCKQEQDLAAAEKIMFCGARVEEG